jgi:hypothetical protein
MSNFEKSLEIHWGTINSNKIFKDSDNIFRNFKRNRFNSRKMGKCLEKYRNSKNILIDV